MVFLHVGLAGTGWGRERLGVWVMRQTWRRDQRVMAIDDCMCMDYDGEEEMA